jgi:hypothetical protein
MNPLILLILMGAVVLLAIAGLYAPARAAGNTHIGWLGMTLLAIAFLLERI